jgi:hypothetical protein
MSAAKVQATGQGFLTLFWCKCCFPAPTSNGSLPGQPGASVSSAIVFAVVPIDGAFCLSQFALGCLFDFLDGLPPRSSFVP